MANQSGQSLRAGGGHASSEDSRRTHTSRYGAEQVQKAAPATTCSGNHQQVGTPVNTPEKHTTAARSRQHTHPSHMLLPGRVLPSTGAEGEETQKKSKKGVNTNAELASTEGEEEEERRGERRRRRGANRKMNDDPPTDRQTEIPPPLWDPVRAQQLADQRPPLLPPPSTLTDASGRVHSAPTVPQPVVIATHLVGPGVLVPGRELQHADDLVNLGAHLLESEVAVLQGLLHAVAARRLGRHEDLDAWKTDNNRSVFHDYYLS